MSHKVECSQAHACGRSYADLSAVERHLDELERLAQAATSPPWLAVNHQTYPDPITGEWKPTLSDTGRVVGDGYCVARCQVRSPQQNHADAAYIAAANPAVVLELVERMRAIGRLIEQWEHDPTGSEATILGEIAALVK